MTAARFSDRQGLSSTSSHRDLSAEILPFVVVAIISCFGLVGCGSPAGGNAAHREERRVGDSGPHATAAQPNESSEAFLPPSGTPDARLENTPDPEARPDGIDQLKENFQPYLDAKERESEEKRESANSTDSTQVVTEGEVANAAINEREKKLLEEAASLAEKLVAGIETGDVKLASQNLVNDDELRRLLTPGGYSILAVHILPGNERRLASVMKTLQGQKIDHAWRPGSLAETPTGEGVWREKTPLMTRSDKEGSPSELVLTTGARVVTVQLETLVYIDGAWKVFRIGRSE